MTSSTIIAFDQVELDCVEAELRFEGYTSRSEITRWLDSFVDACCMDVERDERAAVVDYLAARIGLAR